MGRISYTGNPVDTNTTIWTPTRVHWYMHHEAWFDLANVDWSRSGNTAPEDLGSNNWFLVR